MKCTLFSFEEGVKILGKKTWQAILAIKQLTLRVLFLFLPIKDIYEAFLPLLRNRQNE